MTGRPGKAGKLEEGLSSAARDEDDEERGEEEVGDKRPNGNHNQ